MARRKPPAQLVGSGLIPQIYQDQYNQAEEDYQGQLSDLGKGERSLFRDYGFKGGIGSSGEVNVDVDPTANFGQYQSMLRDFGSRLSQAKQETRGRGLGRAGLAKARENLVRFMLTGEKAALTGSFAKQTADIFGKRGGALTSRNRKFGDVESRALDWWRQFGPDDPDGSVSEPPPSDIPPAVGSLTPYKAITPKTPWTKEEVNALTSPDQGGLKAPGVGGIGAPWVPPSGMTAAQTKEYMKTLPWLQSILGNTDVSSGGVGLGGPGDPYSALVNGSARNRARNVSIY